MATTFWPFTRRRARRPPTAGGATGPVLLELLTYRRTGHSRRDACHYQAKEEREDWFARDPIERLGRHLIERGFAGPTDLEQVRTETQRSFQAAVELARRQPMPSLDDLTTDVLRLTTTFRTENDRWDFNAFDVGNQGTGLGRAARLARSIRNRVPLARST